MLVIRIHRLIVNSAGTSQNVPPLFSHVCLPVTLLDAYAFSFRIDGEKTYITFTEGGKEYGYFSDNVKIHDEDAASLPFKIYSFKKECYRCHRNTNILTYITFSDDTADDLVYPWDKNRLMKSQSMEQVLAHMADPTIE